MARIKLPAGTDVVTHTEGSGKPVVYRAKDDVITVADEHLLRILASVPGSSWLDAPLPELVQAPEAPAKEK